MATGSLYGSVSESTGLYGIGAASGGTYFEWFIFQDSLTAPATPTGGSWSFSNNTGTAPTGWVVSPPPAPVNQIWVSIAVVDSRNATTLTWSVPGLMAASGLPILSASGVPSSGTGSNGQLYINTATTPQALYFKQGGAWTQLTGSNLYATAGANTSITSLTGITGGISSPTFVQLATAGGGGDAVAKLHWNTTFGGPTIGLAGGNTNLQIGQDEFVYVHNNTGSTITKGQVVYISGSQGQRLTVALARANADPTSISVIGFANENIANNADGFVATVGLVSGINTSGFADGASIWLSPTVAGGFTTTKPVAPNHLVLLGYVVKGGSAGAGSIYVFTQNGYELDELHDVLITSVANNNLLRYDSAVPAWVNIAGPSGTIVGTTDTQTLTNKTINAANNTLTNIPNSALVYDSVNVNGVDLTLGAVQTLGADWILPSYAGNAGKVLAVNPSASDVQWINSAGVGTVTSIDISGGTTGLSTFGGPITSAGTITLGGTLALANGGTGSTTAQAALNNLASTVTNGSYLRGNGTNVVMSAIQASDVPTLNQNTTGNAATATTSTNVSGGTASVTGLTVTGNGTITTSSTNDALRITQTGTGNVLVVEDSSNPDSTPFVITSTGKTGVGTLAPAATVHVAGDTILSNVNVLGASYDSVSFSVAGEEATAHSVFFSPDGLKMYVSGTTGDDVNEYNLSTAWVVSSAVYSTTFLISQDTTPQGLYFRADGTKMYVVGAANDSVFQYTLSTPWSVATASYDNISFSFTGQETTVTGLFFKTNGLSMYIVGQTNDTVYQYTLSTAWNVSTATLLQSLSVSGQELTPADLSFTSDGSRMFLLGTTGDDINVYNLTTPWDISTAAFVNVFSVSGQDTSPVGLYVKPDGTKLYMVGSTNDTVYQYTVPSIDIQLTGPTSAAALDVQQDLNVYGNTTGSFRNNSFRENIGGQYYNLVSQADIGTAPNEIPLNQYLGEMAYMNSESVVIQPQASAVPNGIGDMVFELTSNTSLLIKVKGSDGTVRSVTLTLA